MPPRTQQPVGASKHSDIPRGGHAVKSRHVVKVNESVAPLGGARLASPLARSSRQASRQRQLAESELTAERSNNTRLEVLLTVASPRGSPPKPASVCSRVSESGAASFSGLSLQSGAAPGSMPGSHNLPAPSLHSGVRLRSTRLVHCSARRRRTRPPRMPGRSKHTNSSRLPSG